MLETVTKKKAVMTDAKPSGYLREYIAHRNQQLSSKIHHNPTGSIAHTKKIEVFSSTSPVITSFDANSIPKLVPTTHLKSDSSFDTKNSDNSLEQTFEWLLREKLSRVRGLNISKSTLRVL